MKTLRTLWQRQARRIDALSLRERAIMFVSLAVALVAAVDGLVLAPRMAEQKTLATQMRQGATELGALRTRLAGPAADTEAARLGRELAAVQAERQALEADIAGRLGTAAAATSLPDLLARVLRRHERLTLLRLTTAAPEAASPNTLPRQGVEIVMRGNYPDLATYVADTETALPGLRWGTLTITRQGDTAELAAQVFLPGEAR